MGVAAAADGSTIKQMEHQRDRSAIQRRALDTNWRELTNKSDAAIRWVVNIGLKFSAIVSA